MCDPVSLAIGLIGSAGITKYQTDKQESAMREQADDARKLQQEQRAEFLMDKRKADAVPMLKRNASQKSRSAGISGLKIPSVASARTGYNSVGMGGGGGTGLNISK